MTQGSQPVQWLVLDRNIIWVCIPEACIFHGFDNPCAFAETNN